MKKILIADDDRSILTLLSYNFRQSDFAGFNDARTLWY